MEVKFAREKATNSAEIEEVKKDIATIKENINSIKTINQTNDNENQHQTPGTQKQDEFEKFQEHMTEMELIKSKKMNLIVHNLPETEDNAT